MKTIVRAAVSTAFFLTLIVSPVRAQETRELQNRFDQVKKIVGDPLTDEAGIRKALRELDNLAKMTQEFEEGKLEPTDPRSTLARGVVETLRQVRSRLPADLERRAEPRPGFPVPDFQDKELLANLASELDRAQRNLARHVRKAGELGEQGEKLLFEVSKSQEKIAWEAGWPFTKEEAEQVRGAGKLTKKAYANRLKRGSQRINEQIALETDANGRVRGRPFVIHLSANANGRKMLARHLEKVRQIGSLPEDMIRLFEGEEINALKGTADGRPR